MIGLFQAFLAATMTLPVFKVTEVREAVSKKSPGRICSVAEVEVRPQVAGEILEVAFSNGQHVAKGDVLYRIYPVQYKSAVDCSKAKIAECKAKLDYAELSVNRYSELVKRRAVSQDDLDRLRSTCEELRASLAAEQAQLDANADNLAHCTITAPISGKLGSTAFTEGNYVQKGGASLVTLVQTDPIRARFPLSCVDYARMFGGDPSRIVASGEVVVRLVSGAEDCVTGKVEYVENRADESTDTVMVYALLENPDGRFLAGQTVIVTISNRDGLMVPAIPPNAFAQDILGAYVWVVGDDGHVTRRTVVRGNLQNGLQLVHGGVSPGETVVADGVHKVTPDVVVRPAPETR